MPGQQTLDNVRDTVLFESGPYLFTVQQLDEGQTRSGQFAYKAVLVCSEGKAEFIGAAKFETFTMGTPEDPNWDDPETVGPGARGLKNFLKGLGVYEDGKRVVDMVAEAVGGTVGGIVNKELDKGGTMRDNVQRWYPAAPAGNLPTAKPVAPAPKAAPAPKPAAAAAVPKPTPQASAKPEPMIPCGVCNQQVPRSQFGRHVQEHEG